jgi:hypothetical protein
MKSCVPLFTSAQVAMQALQPSQCSGLKAMVL